MSSNELTIKNAAIVTEKEVIENGTVLVKDGKIARILKNGEYPEAQGNVIDAGGSWLLPGFIDMHIHGGYGADFMDADEQAYDTITRFHASQGTTGLLATTMTASKEAIEDVLAAVDAYQRKGMKYAQLLGVHLEGPFISPKWPGAQNPAFIVNPQLEWMKEWTNHYPGLIRMLTLAPEREHALEVIEFVRSQGIVAAAGHTDADYDAIVEAVKHGLNHAVHTFNAMTGLHHRKPGTVGAVMTEEAIVAELVSDGIHVHKACGKLLVKAKDQDNFIMVTDAMSAAGLGDGMYQLGGQDVVVRDGVARLKDGDSLAGSTLTTIGGFRFLVREIGVSVPQASRFASTTPAKHMGLDDRIGSIAEGKDADMLLVSQNGLELQQVWIKGNQLPA
ncbi:N-acetylglucosamine-6-phosphate deacetylase NagA [Paenibacillus larvae subsp. larvae]|uniref:N-acetylglucosamine-6-phosphate deacetylase n=1 Tax=Paenibacillus larvae subsp. larvae TaxID=147375 RepID=A0A2L1TWY4_9BACL|nr:N-acetylglucosamine-6-phosphate deacetylase [Paenibacillus larvae]AQT85797.1 N-acetylglucosamine-6-phosphate deacetylase [Paenibacillus larvae subsp. pulvifaciens]AQZ45980.1 N-acetylglucosamine-6-phosphate deacetylase [Paenibacillus larvae subsp. pulvifaciens]AVF25201.1 N-acetylglucosamine-6-phosphate deacetylase NagA [Paenibacillus larvae subsp. larvae]AVF29978.1 N-acetylglucosamine-6-phosphate deacetylase NagA [Paenibacillus larvae subsp. larvae]MBH0341045.1 N-acetylglucosamine-6-phosphat